MIIDKEFKSLIYALGERELEQLETNILAEGIRDPLVVWSGILLDGHNRYAIAQKHGLSFKTVEIELPSRDAAKLWIIKNQLGRRNLTPQQMSYLRGKRYEMEKLSRTEVTSLGGAASGKNCHQLHFGTTHARGYPNPCCWRVADSSTDRLTGPRLPVIIRLSY